MNIVESLIKILVAPGSGLFITRNEYIAELASVLPFFILKKEIVQNSYTELASAELKRLPTVDGVKLTENFNSTDLDENTIAYHRVKGTITSDSYWRLSTKQLQKDLIAADNNENISGHMIHISSGGGEAWYLDQLAETMRAIEKPMHSFIEKVCGSGGYYIASQSDFVSASTPFDIIGCIGTMTSFMDIQPMFEKWGMRFIEEYATNSDLKNKKYNDLIAGNPEQYIREELDPLRDKFVSDVKLKREKIAALPDDHPVLRGETFHAENSIENGLIDAVENWSSALQRIHEAAIKYKDTQKNRNQALQIIINP